MSAEDNIAIVRRTFEVLFNQQDLAIVDEQASAEFVHHGPGARVLRGPEFIDQLRSRVLFLAFPDLHFTIEDTIAQGDKS